MRRDGPKQLDGGRTTQVGSKYANWRTHFAGRWHHGLHWMQKV
jgi:hypothetical protein